MSLQSPLSRVLGLGSARSGTGHWWGQRVSALALVPLLGWLVVSLIGLGPAEYWAARSWLAEPLNSTLMSLVLVAVIYHSHLGVAVVVEDYSGGATRLVLLVALNLIHIALAVAGLLAIVRIVAEGRV
jgi:succinate dehydrogenase / fumarate reductase membrane anchor subunit